MPGFYGPTQGADRIEEGIPNSAFSRGDVVQLTSVGSLTSFLVAGVQGLVYGVALADSINSINDRVPVSIPGADTLYLSACTPGSVFTVGEKADIIEDAQGRSIVNASQLTPRVVIARPQGGVPYGVPNQSVESRVMVKFLSNVSSVVVLGG